MLKEIEDHKGYYISDDGKVFCNLGRGNRTGIPNEEMELYEIKPRLTKNGYARIYARNNITNKREDLYIHRLVAQYFLNKEDGKNVVNHKNCNRCDNRVDNLEWVTTKENRDYTTKLGHLIRDSITGRYISNFNYECV